MIRTALIALMLAAPAAAGEVEIVAAKATKNAQGWRFDVTLRHADTGWDHYADGWQVRAPDGTELGHRTLAHPHVNEQPFTRSLGGVAIPDGVTEVTIHARDNVDGWSPGALTLILPEN